MLYVKLVTIGIDYSDQMFSNVSSQFNALETRFKGALVAFSAIPSLSSHHKLLYLLWQVCVSTRCPV